MAATARAAVPPPPNPRLFDGTTHSIFGIPIGDQPFGEAPAPYVVFHYDDLRATFSVDRTVRFTSSVDLVALLKADGILGAMVLRMDVACGGTIVDDYTQAPGSTADFNLVRQAIPHFYPCLHDPQARKVMRAVYRRVLKLCTPDAEDSPSK